MVVVEKTDDWVLESVRSYNYLVTISRSKIPQTPSHYKNSINNWPYMSVTIHICIPFTTWDNLIRYILFTCILQMSKSTLRKIIGFTKSPQLKEAGILPRFD